MGRVWGLLILIVAAMFALPAMLQAVESIMPVVLLGVLFVGIGSLLFYRRRRW